MTAAVWLLGSQEVHRYVMLSSDFTVFVKFSAIMLSNVWLLSVGKPLMVDMTYRIARNVPLDLYFVLDFSTTMKTRLTSLADLTQNLGKCLCLLSLC